jgi:hypothetical protein
MREHKRVGKRQSPFGPRIMAGAAGAIAGEIAGAAVGCAAGPAGAVAGMLIGALTGGVVAEVLASDARRARERDEALDKEIGVIGGDLGALRPDPPPVRLDAPTVPRRRPESTHPREAQVVALRDRRR